jgi:hypothetical protein
MKYLITIISLLALQSCVTNTKIINYQTIIVRDTLTISSRHYHIDLQDGTPYCLELPADTIVSEIKFYLSKK